MLVDKFLSLILMILDELFPAKEKKCISAFEEDANSLQNKLLCGLSGKTGVVLTPLRPVGICKIDSRKIDCVSESGFLDQDTTIKVTHVEGNKVTVRQIETD